MNISKDELYQIIKESVDDKTKFILVILGLFSLVSLITLFVGIINLDLRLTIGSVLANLLVRQMIKFFKKSKEELIRKMVEEYDETGI